MDTIAIELALLPRIYWLEKVYKDTDPRLFDSIQKKISTNYELHKFIPGAAIMSDKQPRNIAIVGGSGQVGTPTVAALLDVGIHKITAITRADSISSSFPPKVKVLKGSYDDTAFIISALEGQDVLILQVGITVPSSVTMNFIYAAAKAGVPWIIPTEFGCDNGNQKLRDEVLAMTVKDQYRERIEQLGVSSWIGMISNPWFDFSIKTGLFGIDVLNRKARLYDDGTVKINTTTLRKVGISVAELLSRPDAQLARFQNQFIYLSSFRVSQQEILDAVMRATGTSGADWTVEKVSAEEVTGAAKAKAKAGDMAALMELMYGTIFREGYGGDYNETRVIANAFLELEEEDFEETVREVVEDVEKS
jgi:hypothetical protein